ncbi:MAG: GNAT family N-acetyltransferase [Longimicrobiales bacterium]
MADLDSITPEGHVSDEVIELRLRRVLGPGDLSHRESATAFLAAGLEYRFGIHLREGGSRVGRIHIRVTDDPLVVSALGHMGYAVEEEHRRNGYATRAIRLITPLGWKLGQETIWVLIESDNVPSRRAVERAGFQFVDEVDTHPKARALGLGPTMSRYSASGRA